MQTYPNRLAFLDALKAVASQLIVLHHLAFYGPMSDVANGLAPELFEWLSQNARIAVQVFLVIGGFLAAKGLAPSGEIATENPLEALKKRYLKLVLPYAAALMLSLVCAAIARKLMVHDSIPGKPQALQLLAHLVLLQGIFHFDSLSTGVWYIAIDFQLFALLLCILWVVHRTGFSGQKASLFGVLLVVVTTVASLFHFNRLPSMDDWALYFFGAYGLGVLTYWITRSKHGVIWMAALTITVLCALTISFRPRIAVALFTALAIWIMTISGHLATFPKGRIFAFLGEISYSVFLSHFPILLITNALVHRFWPDNPAVNGIGVLAAWLVSVGSGVIFYHLVEKRTNRLLSRGAQVIYLFGKHLPILGRQGH